MSEKDNHWVRGLKEIPPTSSQFGMELLRALGIETKGVLGFAITCNAGEIATISVTSIAPTKFGKAAAQVLQRYRIEAVESVSLPQLDESTSLESLTRTTHRFSGSPESDRT